MFLLLLAAAFDAWASATMYSVVTQEGEALPFGYLFRLYGVPAVTGACALASLLLGLAEVRHGSKSGRYIISVPMLIACWLIVDLMHWGLQRIM